MSAGIGRAGRAARELARRRLEAGWPRPIRGPAPAGELPLGQFAGDGARQAVEGQATVQAAPDGPSAAAPASASGPGTGQAAAGAIERETPTPSAEEVAERVYRLFCQELRQERERRGPMERGFQ